MSQTRMMKSMGIDDTSSKSRNSRKPLQLIEIAKDRILTPNEIGEIEISLNNLSLNTGDIATKDGIITKVKDSQYRLLSEEEVDSIKRKWIELEERAPNPTAKKLIKTAAERPLTSNEAEEYAKSVNVVTPTRFNYLLKNIVKERPLTQDEIGEVTRYFGYSSDSK